VRVARTSRGSRTNNSVRLVFDRVALENGVSNYGRSKFGTLDAEACQIIHCILRG